MSEEDLIAAQKTAKNAQIGKPWRLAKRNGAYMELLDLIYRPNHQTAVVGKSQAESRNNQPISLSIG